MWTEHNIRPRRGSIPRQTKLKNMNAPRPYRVTWTRPYQGAGNPTQAEDDYDKLRQAWRKADEVWAELGSGSRVEVFRGATKIGRNGRAR